jgi:hypothetical protein
MIGPASRDQVLEVALAMRSRDLTEFRATSPHEDAWDLANDLASRYGDRDDVLCGLIDNEPICIGGTIETWPGVMTLLFFATPEFPRIGLEITRFIKHQLFPRYVSAGIHRVQAVSLDGYDEVHAWLETLGMVREGTLPAFGKGREDFAQFGRVWDARPTGSPG